MKIVVTTPTGHIGSKLANILLDRKADVTVIARHPEKVQPLASRGAKVIPGQHDNPAILEQALRGADALFWLTPPNYTSRDPLGDARRLADVGAAAIQKNPGVHVVQNSSAGAFLPSGTGPILGLRYTEEVFRTVAKNMTALRPNEFMENVFMSLPTILSDGSIYSSMPVSLGMPQIATQDIAQIAADVLLANINGQRVIDIVGPEDISLERSAKIISQETGRPVKAVTVPGDKLKSALVHAGISTEMASLFIEMEAAAPNILHSFHGDEKRTGKITYQEFVREAFLPAYKQAAASAA
jgi:uncharacterized protein YbjT (DUF2867 family)